MASFFLEFVSFVVTHFGILWELTLNKACSCTSEVWEGVAGLTRTVCSFCYTYANRWEGEVDNAGLVFLT